MRKRGSHTGHGSLSLHGYLPRTLSCCLAEVSWLYDALCLFHLAFIAAGAHASLPGSS
ncbi:hypothetical protein RR46_05496 [Papilio xuthus]|uniref:Uncharacterized protein n=1 Tax=Papilio xuthus TaxID=66420 RepID=A0A194Q153_PAPXU|nr:hypothetical protein RR46_05496 [Papilio xuthus]